MTAINLLPWRETLRKERQKQFLVALGVSAGIMLGVVGVAHLQISQMTERQEMRNRFLQAQIERVEKQIKEINSLEKEKANLLARMNVIQDLQQGRPHIVHIFDELVKVLPEGVYLTSVKQSKKSLALSGIAQSNARVSAYMRNLDGSGWFANPKLSIIQAKSKSDEGRKSQFSLTVNVINPVAEEGAG